MRLLLSGGGDPEFVVPLDELFASQIGPGKPVLYIPVAMEPHIFTYDQCHAWFLETYRPYGIEHIEMCTDLACAQDLEQYTAVYIGGGNTFKLLKAMKESHFDAKLTAYLRGGGLAYGGSAGALIFGQTIRSTHDVNDAGLADLSGLNLLGGRDVWAHYREDEAARIEAYGSDLYILYEESGLFIQDGKIESVGKPYLEKVRT